MTSHVECARLLSKSVNVRQRTVRVHRVTEVSVYQVERVLSTGVYLFMQLIWSLAASEDISLSPQGDSCSVELLWSSLTARLTELEPAVREMIYQTLTSESLSYFSAVSY